MLELLLEYLLLRGMSVKMIKIPCKNCHRNFKVLTPEGICWACYLNKYKEPPKTGAYKEGK